MLENPPHPKPAPRRPSLLVSFSRSQVAAGAATAAEYVLLFSLVELFRVWYVIAVAAGAFLGAVLNFILNRHWSFRATHRRAHLQAWRYALVSGGSLALNTGGVYLVTEYLHVHYAISVVLVSVAVGVFYNFPLQRNFVFR